MANYIFDKVEYGGHTYTVTDSGALQLTGGNVTGAVNFGDSVSTDSLIAGNLVVNGAVSFTNNLQANTINGISVGSSPKFTDEKVKIAAATNNATYYPIMGAEAGTATRQYSTYLKYKTDTKILVLDGEFRATKGIFKELIAAKGQISDLSVNNLTADTAIVTGLLDVKGELHTNKWTNANIANIGGSFYISPTVNTTIAEGNTPMSIIFSGSANARTIQVTGGSFVTDTVKIYSDGSTSTASWSIGSRVMMTGNIRVGTNGVDYPLGTINGYLTVALTSNGFTIGEVNSLALEAIISEIGTSNIKSYNLSISMLEIGPKTALKPVGIMMTSYGVDKSTYLDIYGGVNQKNSSTSKVDPNLRIGYLGGLSSYTDSAGNTHQPVGWGIYTDNGFFKGVVVADSGSIGNFTINADSIYSGSHSAYNSNNSGIFLGRPSSSSSDYYVAGGPQALWYLKSDGSAKIGQMSLSTTGVLTLGSISLNASGTAMVGPWTISSDAIYRTSSTFGNASGMYFGTSGISLSDTFKVTSAGALTATSGSIGGWTLSAKDFWKKTNGNNNGSKYFYVNANNVGGTNYVLAAATRESNAWSYKFYVNGNGKLYASDANITGAVVANTFTAKRGSSSANNAVVIDSGGMKVYNKSGTVTSTFNGDITLASDAATVTIGKTGTNDTYNTVISSTGLNVRNNATSVAWFGNTVRIGNENDNHILINSDGISFKKTTNIIGSISQISRTRGNITYNNTMCLTATEYFELVVNSRIDNTPQLAITKDMFEVFTGNCGLYVGDYDYNGDDQNDSVILSLSGMTNIKTIIEASNTNSSIWLGVDTNGFRGIADEGWIICRRPNNHIYLPSVYTYTGSNAPNMVVYGTGETVRSTSSSKRYKKEIENIRGAEALYEVKVRQFKYRDDYLSSNDLRYNKTLPGFIVEELEEVYPIAIDYENEQPEDWNFRYIIPGMLKLIQDQHKEIEELKSRIS